VWYGLEPNSYNSFGGKISTVARKPIDPSRQNKKGTITDLEANGGFTVDFTKSALNRLLQGFLFATAYERAATSPLNGTAVTITSTTATTYVAATGLAGFNTPNMLVFAEGFTNSANNGLKVVTSATATAVTVTGNVVEASPPSAAKLTEVGYQFAAGDLSATVASGLITLSSAANAMPNIQVGSWFWLGGDSALTKFDTMPSGWFRVRSRSAASIVVDDCMLAGGAAPSSDAGAAKTVQMFFGTIIKNEQSSSNIVRRTYSLERQLGAGPNGQMAEYVDGAVPNEFKLNIPGQDKITCEMSFVGCDVKYVAGVTGDLIRGGTRVAAQGEDAYNTSSDTKMTKLAINPVLGSAGSQLFAYATETSISVNNNAKASKALGVLGALDVNVGNIEIKGSISAYFADTAALAAVRNNADVSYSIANVNKLKNYGFLFDIPLLQVAVDALNVAKDADIMVPLDLSGAQSKFGHTVLYEFFPYLPNLAAS
jgi:hypothetical protein